MSALIGGIEAGGTKFVLVTGTSPTDITARHVIQTRAPEETLAQAADWFAQQGAISALGIGSFGPVDLDPASSGWGHITNTPKPGWAQCNIAGYFGRRLGVPVGFDTDVNAAALAEATYGAGRTATSLVYITIGTGIGGGLVIDGKPVHGTAHPEMGHIFVRRAGPGDDWPGNCPHHGACLEGLSSGPAIIARWGASLSELPPGHEAHALVAGYLAQLCHNLFAMLAVEVIVLGGGVTNAPGLFGKIKELVGEIGASYLPGRERQSIVAPALGENSGVVGSLSLAHAALHQP